MGYLISCIVWASFFTSSQLPIAAATDGVVKSSAVNFINQVWVQARVRIFAFLEHGFDSFQFEDEQYYVHVYWLLMNRL